MAANHNTSVLPLGLGSNIMNAAPNAEKDVFANGLDLKVGSQDKSEYSDGGVKVDVEESDEDKIIDPYVPFPVDPNAPVEGKILRIRSIVLGLICGSLVNASNVYLGTCLYPVSHLLSC